MVRSAVACATALSKVGVWLLLFSARGGGLGIDCLLGVGTGSRFNCCGLGARFSTGGKIGVPETVLIFCAFWKLDDGVVNDPDLRGTSVGVGSGLAEILCFVGESPDIE